MAMVVSIAFVGNLEGCQGDDEKANDASTGDTRVDSEKKDTAVKADSSADSAMAADRTPDVTVSGDSGSAADRGNDLGTRLDIDSTVSLDSGLDTQIRLDVERLLDSAGSEAGSIDGGSIADAGKDVVTLVDVAVKTDSKVDSNQSPFCQGVFIDNNGRPDIYPIIYREEESVKAQFNTEKARLISTYGLTESDYDITATPITWAASIEKYGSGEVTVPGPIDKNNTLEIAKNFLSEWDVFFKYKGILTTSDQPYCFNKFCKVILTQDYCGLPLYSDENDYSGKTWVFLYFTPIEAVSSITSYFVPMVPMPRNVLLTDEEAKQAVVGRTFTYACATGERTAQVTSKDQITVPSTQTIYVRKSSTVAAALEYRLAIPTTVDINSLSWIVYVDGIDGTVIDDVAEFICD
jgi:hypothetical protein